MEKEIKKTRITAPFMFHLDPNLYHKFKVVCKIKQKSYSSVMEDMMQTYVNQVPSINELLENEFKQDGE